MSVAASSITTAEQLLNAGDIGRCELVQLEVALLPYVGDTRESRDERGGGRDRDRDRDRDR